MKLYTAKAISKVLGITERRINQLRADGIIREYRENLFILSGAVQDYIDYIKNGSTADGTDYNAERALLAKAKRENQELDLKIKKKELHESADIERIITDMLINFKSRLMAIPSKLSPVLAKKTDNAEIFNILRESIEEALTELADFDSVFNYPEEREEKE